MSMPRAPAIRLIFIPVVVATALSGCSPGRPANPLPAAELDAAIGAAIGDPNTCLLLADQTTGKVVYRYGESINCDRALPACDRSGSMSATQALALAASPGGRGASCPSNADGSRMVGWAEGLVKSRRRTLIYSAAMEGETALPGHEIAARLDGAFKRAGL